jgi:hypothetical protein
MNPLALCCAQIDKRAMTVCGETIRPRCVKHPGMHCTCCVHAQTGTVHSCGMVGLALLGIKAHMASLHFGLSVALFGQPSFKMKGASRHVSRERIYARNVPETCQKRARNVRSPPDLASGLTFWTPALDQLRGGAANRPGVDRSRPWWPCSPA